MAQSNQKKKKQPKGPSVSSGITSIAVGVFAALWTYSVYVQKRSGLELFIGMLLVCMSLFLATYNFQGARNQKAAERRKSLPRYHVKAKPSLRIKSKRLHKAKNKAKKK